MLPALGKVAVKGVVQRRWPRHTGEGDFAGAAAVVGAAVGAGVAAAGTAAGVAASTPTAGVALCSGRLGKGKDRKAQETKEADHGPGAGTPKEREWPRSGNESMAILQSRTTTTKRSDDRRMLTFSVVV